MLLWTVLFLVEAIRCTGEDIVVAYFAEWANQVYGYKDVPYDKITHLVYAFALLEKDTYKPLIQNSPLLHNIVKEAHSNDVRISLSIGGWSGSKYFSSLVKSEEKVSLFIDMLLDLIKNYNLDGIDIDWEFPGRVGEVGNEIDFANDSRNFIKMLAEMRRRFDAYSSETKTKLELSIATDAKPLEEATQESNWQPKSMSDLSELANYVDFISIMAYNINGPWSPTTAPAAPIDPEPEKGNPFSVRKSIETWIATKFPKNKMVLGIPFYGYYGKTDFNMNQSPSNQFQLRTKQSSDKSKLGNKCSRFPKDSDNINWRQLREYGILTSTDTTSEGWYRYWDNKSQTPWLFNSECGVYISYDDPESVKSKTKLSQDFGLKGIMLWSLDYDNGELIQGFELKDSTKKKLNNTNSLKGPGKNGTTESSSSSSSSAFDPKTLLFLPISFWIAQKI